MNYRSVIVLLAKNLSISSRVVLDADVKWVKKNWISFMHKSEVIGENSPSIASPLWQFYKKNIRDNNMVKKVKKMNESIEHIGSEFNHSVELSDNELLKYGSKSGDENV